MQGMYHLLQMHGQHRFCSHRMRFFFNLGFSWGFSAFLVGCTLVHTKGCSCDNYNIISVHLLCSSEMSVCSFLPQGCLQVVWNRAPAPAQPIGCRCPAQVKREMFSCRDVVVEKVLQPWGTSEAGAWQENCQVLEARSHWSPPWLPQPLIDSVCLLPRAISRHRMPSKTTRYSMEILPPATQSQLFLGKSSWAVPHSCRDLRRAACYSSLFTWEGVCTPRVHLLWLFSLWGKGEGGEIICLVYISLW